MPVPACPPVCANALHSRVLSNSQSPLTGGVTWQSALCYNFMKDKPGNPINESTAQLLKNRWKDVRLVIADEFSMMSAADLREINRRLQIAKSSSEEWGGVHIIFGGDFYQVMKSMPK